MLCIYFPWMISSPFLTFFSGATQGLYGCVIFSPSTVFFFFSKQKDSEGQNNLICFLQLVSLPSIFSSSQEVVIYRAFCQSSEWIWLTPECSVPRLLSCGTAQDPVWYSFEMVYRKPFHLKQMCAFVSFWSLGTQLFSWRLFLTDVLFQSVPWVLAVLAVIQTKGPAGKGPRYQGSSRNTRKNPAIRGKEFCILVQVATLNSLWRETLRVILPFN